MCIHHICSSNRMPVWPSDEDASGVAIPNSAGASFAFAHRSSLSSSRHLNVQHFLQHPPHQCLQSRHCDFTTCSYPSGRELRAHLRDWRCPRNRHMRLLYLTTTSNATQASSRAVPKHCRCSFRANGSWVITWSADEYITDGRREAPGSRNSGLGLIASQLTRTHVTERISLNRFKERGRMFRRDRPGKHASIGVPSPVLLACPVSCGLIPSLACVSPWKAVS